MQGLLYKGEAEVLDNRFSYLLLLLKSLPLDDSLKLPFLKLSIMKLRNLSFLLALMLMQCAALTQAQELRFSKVFYNPNFGMHVLASVEAGQDSILMVSSAGEGSDNGAVHLMDAEGVMHWSKRLVGEASVVLPVDVVRTADGNFLICATEYSYNPYVFSILLAKLNAAGDLIWMKKFNHDTHTFSSGISIAGNGDILVTGYTLPGEFPSGSKLLLVRFTSAGAFLWGKTYETASLRDKGTAVAELPNGQLIVGGRTKGSSAYSSELCLLQTDALGNVTWAKQKITPGNYSNSQINDLITAPLGFYLYGSALDASGMVLSFNQEGEIIWSKSLSMSFNFDDLVYRSRIKTTSGGDLLLSSGMLYGDGIVACLTEDGNIVWSQYVSMQGMEANPLSDGGYLFLGNGPLIGVKDVYEPQTGVVRTNASGEGVSCTSTDDIYSEDYVPVFENLTYILTDVGSANDYSLQWEEFPLESFDGCVDFIGAVEGNPDAANALKVYPNPGNGPFRLLLEDLQPENIVQLTVVNSMGQNIFSREGDWSRLQMIDRELPAGLYLISVRTSKRVFTTRLIVN